MIESKKIQKSTNTSLTDVYDISLDGTVVNALGMNIISNTDGFNFQLPKVHRFTKDCPYISTGEGRNTIKGKAYVDGYADIAEFEDMYLNKAYNGGINKTGIDLEEILDSTINFARKNYADLMPDGKIKLVGNTIKSKKMPIYIEKFLNEAIKLLLHGKGKEFLEYYYDYIEKIYNLKIPLKDIATVGKIKTSLEQYKASCRQLTAGGTKKARQAWYELAIKDGLNVNMGDTIYYINTGTKKSSSDVQRKTVYYMALPNGEKRYDVYDDGEPRRDTRGKTISYLKVIEAEYKKYIKDTEKENGGHWPNGSKPKMAEFARRLFPQIQEEDQIIFNCVRLSNEIVEDEDDHFCDETFEYNSEKYIDMFNKRIRPLLVCFDRSIRTTTNDKGKEIDNILITNPIDRKTFTEEESKLVSGQPYRPTDQDTYEALMTMEDKEIRFWLSVDREPPYAKECGIDWEWVKTDYYKRMKELESKEIQDEIRKYNEVVANLKKSDVDALIDEGILPEKLLKFVDEDIETGDLKSKRYGVRLGTIFDFIDKDFSNETDDE